MANEETRKRVAALLAARTKEVEQYAGRLELFLQRNLRDIARRLNSGELADLEAAALLGGLITELEQAGLTEQVTELTEIYGNELTRVRQQFIDFSGAAIRYTDNDLAITEQLILFDVSRVSEQVVARVGDLRQQILTSIITGQIPDVEQVIEDTAGRVRRNIITEVDTNMQAFNRAVTVRKAQDVGLDLFAYVGGIIKTSREFCRERDGKVFTQAQIDSWDNGQGLPASVYLGGYNCRHSLLPVSEAQISDFGLERG